MTKRGDIFAIRDRKGFFKTLFVVLAAGHKVIKLSGVNVGMQLRTKISAETFIGGPDNTWKAEPFDDRLRKRMAKEGFSDGTVCSKREINRLEGHAKRFRGMVLMVLRGPKDTKRGKEKPGGVSLLDLDVND